MSPEKSFQNSKKNILKSVVFLGSRLISYVASKRVKRPIGGKGPRDEKERMVNMLLSPPGYFTPLDATWEMSLLPRNTTHLKYFFFESRKLFSGLI